MRIWNEKICDNTDLESGTNKSEFEFEHFFLYAQIFYFILLNNCKVTGVFKL